MSCRRCYSGTRNLRPGGDQSAVMINCIDFGNYPGIADYQLETECGIELPKAGKLGVSIVDGSGGVRISEFTPGGAAQAAGWLSATASLRSTA